MTVKEFVENGMNHKLRDVSLEEKIHLLESEICTLNEEIEKDIITGDTQVAIWKMSSVVLLEEELMKTERQLLKNNAILIYS